MENENRVSSISNAHSYTQMAKFWSTHSRADYEDQSYEADITFAATVLLNLVPIEPELMQEYNRIPVYCATRRCADEPDKPAY